MCWVINLAQEKPERLLRALLMAAFTKEELAAGCAMGKRQAHNKKRSMVGVPLNPVILSDIKHTFLKRKLRAGKRGFCNPYIYHN